MKSLSGEKMATTLALILKPGKVHRALANYSTLSILAGRKEANKMKVTWKLNGNCKNCLVHYLQRNISKRLRSARRAGQDSGGCGVFFPSFFALLSVIAPFFRSFVPLKRMNAAAGRKKRRERAQWKMRKLEWKIEENRGKMAELCEHIFPTWLNGWLTIHKTLVYQTE